MKNFFAPARLGVILLFGAAFPASANQFTAVISVNEILTAVNSLGAAFSGACGASAPYTKNCGIYAVSFVSDTESSTASNGVGPSAFWSATTILGKPSVEISNGQEQMLGLSPTTTPSGTYTENLNATALGSPSVISTGTISFLLTNSTSNTSAVGDTITLNVRAAGIVPVGTVSAGTTDGGGKGNQNITFTLTPEPSSILLVLSGIAALGFAKVRRKRI